MAERRTEGGTDDIPRPGCCGEWSQDALNLMDVSVTSGTEVDNKLVGVSWRWKDQVHDLTMRRKSHKGWKGRSEGASGCSTAKVLIVECRRRSIQMNGLALSVGEGTWVKDAGEGGVGEWTKVSGMDGGK